MSACNYHTLQRMKQTAKDYWPEKMPDGSMALDSIKTKVIVKRETEGLMAGWVSARYEVDEEPSAWFMELSDHCVC